MMQFMGKKEIDAERAAFAERMNEICNDKKIPPKGKNRQTILGKQFSVTQEAAGKWLRGMGFPSMTMAIRIARWAEINVQWLLTGEGDKHVPAKLAHDNHRIQHVLKVMENLPDYAVDEAVKEVDSIAKLIEQATKAAQK